MTCAFVIVLKGRRSINLVCGVVMKIKKAVICLFSIKLPASVERKELIDPITKTGLDKSTTSGALSSMIMFLGVIHCSQLRGVRSLGKFRINCSLNMEVYQ